MKQVFQKLFKNETFIAILLIFLTTVITHGLSIARLGYYHDDWYLLWSGAARGAESIIPLFSTDRPFMGVVYSYVYRLLGDNVINWHLYALLWRFLGGMAFFWILRLIWPKQKYITTLMTVLFIVYPGFLSEPNANTKQNHLFGFGTALFSIAFMLQAIKTSSMVWKISWGLLSVICTANYLFIYEYMIGFEGLRLVLLGYLLFRDGLRAFRSLAKEILKKWWPYPIVVAVFLYWRLFIFDSSRNATDASGLFGDYLGNLRYMSIRLLFETAKDFLDTSILAWFVKPYHSFASAEYSALTSALLIGGLVALLIFIYSFLTRKLWDAEYNEETPGLIKDFIWIGTFAIVCAVSPVVLSGRQVDLTDAYKSYGLHPIAGVVLFVTGILLMFQRNFRKLALISLVIISVATQQLNANRWEQFWDYQRETWWQLTWRAPDIKDDTLVMTYFPDGYRLQQDYEVWGPVNLIYRPNPSEAPVIQAEVLTSETAYDILKQNILNNRVRDIKLHRDFHNLLLLSLPSSSSCVHIIDGTLPVYSESETLLIQQVGEYSRVDRIIPLGQSPVPPFAIFGSEPPHDWCYYYQKASLARQAGDWNEIGRLYDQALDQGLVARDKSEVFPFFEGLVNLGRYEDARAIYNKDIKGRGKIRFSLCTSLTEDPGYPPDFGYNYKKIYEILCDS